MHILCTICSDLVNQAENIYVTKCGHIFHHQCLAQWIERSKSCPQCRNKVTDKWMFRLYPTVSNETTGDDAATLQSRLDDAQLQLRQQSTLSKEKDEKLAALNIDVKRNEDLLKSYEKKLVSRDSALTALKEQMEYVKIEISKITILQEENEMLKKNIQTLNGLQKVLNATSDDVENMLRGYTDLKTIAIFATALKRALCESESKKNECRDRLHATKQQLGVERKNVADLQAKLQQLEERLAHTQQKYQAQKRKSSEASNESPDEETTPKMPRYSDVVDLNTAILTDTSNTSNTSFDSLVNKIVNSDSPYLSLKQGCLALSVLNRNRVPDHSPERRIKPSEFSIINAARLDALKTAAEKGPLSIFRKKCPIEHDPSDLNRNISEMDVSYDGLGGHSKLDKFPVPIPRPFRSLVPKLTAKHKLKRPSVPSGSQDIGKLFENIKQQIS